LTDVREFAFEYRGEVVETFVLSAAAARAAGIEGLDVTELPERYPPWVTALVPICEVCLEAARNNR
jgi:hypothetical protein